MLNKRAKRRRMPPRAIVLLFLYFALWINRHESAIIDYLMLENRILRGKLGKRKFRLTHEERMQLLRRAWRMGMERFRRFVNIVQPETILRWHRKMIAKKHTFPHTSDGRPGITPQVIEWLVRMKKENSECGYKKLSGMLGNLGYNVSPSTIRNILAREGFTPVPRKRRSLNWLKFWRVNFPTLAAADFFSSEVWIAGRLVTHHTFFAIRLKTREVEILGTTTHQTDEFLVEAAHRISQSKSVFQGVTHLIYDRDRVYGRFPQLLEKLGIGSARTPAHSPNCNAFAERFVRSIRYECLNYLVPFGRRSLDNAIEQYVEYYNHERNHQGIKNRIIDPRERLGRRRGVIRLRQRLGGMLRYYYRDAA